MATPGDTVPFRLGIDFGTWNTAAILRWPDGHTRPLLFDGSPLLPSAVYAGADGRLLVGRDAIHAAGLDPARLEATPKRRIGQPSIVLGDRDVEPVAMIAAALQRVHDEAVRVGSADLTVTLTHPAGWTAAHTKVLTDAAARAGLPEPALLPEPVAAAGFFAAVLGRTLPAGSALVVYDFGGGTFDASVVTPVGTGYEVLAVAGLPDVGGVDLDAALLDHLTSQHRELDPAAWQRLGDPQTPADRRHRRHLVEDVRAAKEMLSRAESATVPIPVLEREARITRAEFEALARPFLDRTVETTRTAIGRSGLPKEKIAAILLVGGSSRIPLVATLLRDRLGLEPATIDQPETVVAEGSVRLATGGTGTTRAASALPVAPSYHQPAAQTTQAFPTPAPQAAPTVPSGPPAAPPVPTAPPPQVIPAHQPGPAYPGPGPAVTPPRGREYRSGRRRRWIPAVLVVVVLAALAGAAVRFGPQLLESFGPGPATPGGPGQTSAPPYARTDPPAWVPAGFAKIVDDEQEAAVDLTRPPANGGTCAYEAAGMLRVQRDEFNVTGCFTTPAVRAITVADGAVEAQFRIGSGCGVMWLRVTSVGYVVMVCADGTVQVHDLAADPASSFTRLANWRPAFDRAKVVIGLLARGNELTVYVDGVAQPTLSDATPIAQGRVGLGAFQPADATSTDVTITQFRAWAMPATGA